MNLTKRAGLAAALAALALAGCSRGPAQEPVAQAGSKAIQVKGSDTMVNLGQSWAEEYMKRHPDASVAVTGGGSGTGIAALVNGTCDIAECSRAMKASEKDAAAKKGRAPKEIQVAIDALVVAVNPANPVTQLTLAQLSDIFTGKITSWKAVGGPDQPIVILSRDRNSGTHVYFLEHVLRHGEEKGPEEYAKAALMMTSSQAEVDEIASSPGAIGYYGLGYLGPKNKAVAVAKDAAGPFVLPSADAAISGAYPISRPLFFYTPGEPAGDAKAFIDFVLSDDGQRVVKKMEFVPLRAVKE
jgi:phosphate transport system substrate-binding protein